MKGELVTGQLLGTVLAVQANFYKVQMDFARKGDEGDEGDEGEFDFLSPPSPLPPILLCTRRSRLKKIGQYVTAGDRVIVEEPDWVDGRGAIAEVLPRTSQLDRPAIANVNQILLVLAVADPPLEPYQLSRFLVKAETTGLDVVLCLNKCDLIPASEREQVSQRLQKWGYQPVFMSVYNSINIDEVASRLKDKITVMAGASGVGKSSLINKLITDINLRVGEVSGKLAKGRHTTRHVELFDLPNGGLLADTPGFNQPDLDCSPEELIHYFPEARERLKTGRCRFDDCSHRDEPGCIVRGDWERYEHYLILLEEVKALATQLSSQADPESTQKLKSSGKGQSSYEPKLETKKYRQKSRRTQLQELQQLYQENNDDD
jgi:ribosome biogenesis GTPase